MYGAEIDVSELDKGVIVEVVVVSAGAAVEVAFGAKGNLLQVKC